MGQWEEFVRRGSAVFCSPPLHMLLEVALCVPCSLAACCGVFPSQELQDDFKLPTPTSSWVSHYTVSLPYPFSAQEEAITFFRPLVLPLNSHLGVRQHHYPPKDPCRKPPLHPHSHLHPSPADSSSPQSHLFPFPP